MWLLVGWQGGHLAHKNCFKTLVTKDWEWRGQLYEGLCLMWSLVLYDVISTFDHMISNLTVAEVYYCDHDWRVCVCDCVYVLKWKSRSTAWHTSRSGSATVQELSVLAGRKAKYKCLTATVSMPRPTILPSTYSSQLTRGWWESVAGDSACLIIISKQHNITKSISL